MLARKLEKLLLLTSSDDEQRVLFAIRTANALLRIAGKKWSEVLVGTKKTGPVKPSPEAA